MNSLLLTSLGAAASVSASVIAGGAYAVRGKSAQFFGASSYHGSRDRRSVAITFDDGPSEGSLRLIDYLAEQEVRATFFQCGLNVLRHPSIARRIAAAGHEIGNHTYSHPRLCPRLSRSPNLLSPGQVLREFSEAQDVIVSETGARPTLLRAPYGFRWFGVGAAQRQLQLHGVMWSAIGNDWELDAAGVAQRILKGVRPGSILCLHDGRDVRPAPDISVTLAAARLIVPALRDAGFRFEKVSELLTR